MKIVNQLGRPPRTFGAPVCRVRWSVVHQGTRRYNRMNMFIYWEAIDLMGCKVNDRFIIDTRGEVEFALVPDAKGLRVVPTKRRSMRITTHVKNNTMKEGYYLVSKKGGGYLLTHYMG